MHHVIHELWKDTNWQTVSSNGFVQNSRLSYASRVVRSRSFVRGYSFEVSSSGFEKNNTIAPTILAWIEPVVQEKDSKEIACKC
mmetsp:Transcript_7762/g.13714  ORF Transcript_7762/g.13714 Transcript_7762/m.13714 type:complete len:84 (+) Transcript_7762:256-507(+)